VKASPHTFCKGLGFYRVKTILNLATWFSSPDWNRIKVELVLLSLVGKDVDIPQSGSVTLRPNLELYHLLNIIWLINNDPKARQNLSLYQLNWEKKCLPVYLSGFRFGFVFIHYMLFLG